MGQFKNAGLNVQEYVYDFAVDGGATGEIILSNKANREPIPVGAVIKAVTLKVLTTFTSDGSATLEWGNGDDPNGYSGATIAVASLTAGAVFNGWDNAAALIWDDTNDHQIPVNIADAADGRVSVTIATAAMTAGKAVIMVEYLHPAASA